MKKEKESRGGHRINRINAEENAVMDKGRGVVDSKRMYGRRLGGEDNIHRTVIDFMAVRRCDRMDVEETEGSDHWSMKIGIRTGNKREQEKEHEKRGKGDETIERENEEGELGGSRGKIWKRPYRVVVGGNK